MVIPKPLRDQVGMHAGEVEVSLSGSRLHLEPVTRDDLVEEEGRLVIPSSGTPFDEATVRAILDAGR